MGQRIPPKKTIYDLERERAQTESRQALTSGQQALQRRQAQLGGGPSGAFLKQEQLLRQDVAEQQAGRLSQIGAVEAQEAERLAESERQRKFAAEQSQLGRQFQTSERLGAQKFAAGESALTRRQQESQFGRQFGLAREQFSFQKQLGLEQLSLQEAAQKLNEEVQRGQLDLATAQQAMQEKQFAEQMAFNRENLRQQQDQFLISQYGGVKDPETGEITMPTIAGQEAQARMKALAAQVELANSEFANTKAQQSIENQINAATNAATLLNNLVQAKVFDATQIADIMNAFSVTVDANGNIVPTQVSTAFFSPFSGGSNIVSSTSPGSQAAAEAPAAETAASAAAPAAQQVPAGQPPLPPNPTNFDYFSRGMVPPGFVWGS